MNGVKDPGDVPQDVETPDRRGRIDRGRACRRVGDVGHMTDDHVRCGRLDLGQPLLDDVDREDASTIGGEPQGNRPADARPRHR